MGKRKEERERILAIIERYIEQAASGDVGYWDANHKPRQAERAGRCAMLQALKREIRGHKEAGEPSDGQ